MTTLADLAVALDRAADVLAANGAGDRSEDHLGHGATRLLMALRMDEELAS